MQQNQRVDGAGQARPRVPMMPNRANVCGMVLSVKDAGREDSPDLKAVEIIVEETGNIAGQANFMASYKGRGVTALVEPEAATVFQELVGKRIQVEMNVVGDERKGPIVRICSRPVVS